MSSRFTVNQPNLGAIWSQQGGQNLQNQQAQANLDLAPLRKRQAELGIEQAEQNLDQSGQEAKLKEGAGELYGYMAEANQGGGFDQERWKGALARGAQAARASGNEAKAVNLEKMASDPNSPNMANGIIQQAASRNLLQLPQESAPTSDPTSIAEAKFAYPDDPAKQQEYVARKSRGGSRTPEEEALISEKKAEAAVVGQAKGEALAGDVAGSKANIKKTSDAQAALDKEKNADRKKVVAERYSSIVFENIESAMAQVEAEPFWTTGVVGQALGAIGGTKAHDLMATLETVEAGIAFDRLQAMRDSSVTGGALGQVSEMELNLLKAALGSVRQSQSNEQLASRLKRMHDVYDEIVHGDESWKQAQKQSDNAFDSMESAEAANLPIGTEITIGGRRAIVE